MALSSLTDMFIDQARIFIQAGRGGDGACQFRREKFVPRGGPDGGDGGHGGTIVVTASERLTSLLDFRYRRHYRADPGGAGGGSHKHGRTAPDITIMVPVGTIILDDETGEPIGDLTVDGQVQIIARGGKGGRGNSHFATPTNRVPTHAELGSEGEARWLRLELKLLADVGLVGLPNAGKSTLMASISAARPKIADYAFTTLTPNLGVVQFGNDQSFVMADIPGLIEGAHQGKGLGFQFLRHVERTSFLLHLVDISDWASEDPVMSFESMQRELATYNQHLAARPFAMVATKSDITVTSDKWERLHAYCLQHTISLFRISAATREGLEALVAFVGYQVNSLPRPSCVTKS